MQLLFGALDLLLDQLLLLWVEPGLAKLLQTVLDLGGELLQYELPLLLHLSSHCIEFVPLLSFSLGELGSSIVLLRLWGLGWSSVDGSLRASARRLASNIVDELDLLVAPDRLP